MSLQIDIEIFDQEVVDTDTGTFMHRLSSDSRGNRQFDYLYTTHGLYIVNLTLHLKLKISNWICKCFHFRDIDVPIGFRK